jgi:hypothetical protein
VWTVPLLRFADVSRIPRTNAIELVELTPSLASTASCPEAIWQSARYWYEYFDTTARERGSKAIHPSGDYVARQHSVAMRLPDKPDGPATPPRRAALRPRGARGRSECA